MSHKVLNWLIFIVFIMLFINLIRSFSNLKKQSEIIDGVQEKLRKVKEEQNNLLRQLSRAKSKQYIEKQAREKLNLGREEEIVIMLPSISPDIPITPIPIDTSSNWEKWLRVFL